jgi:hypothetical protein
MLRLASSGRVSCAPACQAPRLQARRPKTAAYIDPHRDGDSLGWPASPVGPLSPSSSLHLSTRLVPNLKNR